MVKRGEIFVSKDIFEDEPDEVKKKPGRPKVQITKAVRRVESHRGWRMKE